MYRKEPIYITPKDTYLAEDKVKPYSGRIRRSSEKHVKEVVSKLWDIQDTKPKQ